MRYWQSDNRTSTAVLPHLRATQKGNLARPHSRSPQAVRKPEGPAMHCHLNRGDWSFHLTNEKKKKKNSRLLRADLSGSSHTSNSEIGTPVATLPGSWSYRVSVGTGRPGVSILCLGETESLICKFYLSVAARPIV